jgi:hypothetical protein
LIKREELYYADDEDIKSLALWMNDDVLDEFF